jgi:hypothetical protein
MWDEITRREPESRRRCSQAPGVDSALITMENFKQWMKSEPYKTKVDDRLGASGSPYFGVDPKSPLYLEAQAALLRRSNLEQEQLMLLLPVANEKLGTDFQLGIITKGFRCKFNMDTMACDNNFDVNTSAVLNSSDANLLSQMLLSSL